MGTFDNKVALVTGGASGIGRAVVERLASEGASVVVADVDEPGGISVAGAAGGLFVRTDVTNSEHMRAVVAETLHRFDRLDIAHLNAGILTGETDVERLSVDDYRRAVAINVDGVVFGVMAAVPAMVDGGAIVVTASIAGLMGYPGDPVYGLTKHAVIGFVRAVSEQLATKNITINAVCPGFADTPILGPFAEQFRLAGFPLLAPEEVADAIAQIARSDRTGKAFVCQPGRICEEYEFRGVPGPRTPGAEGMPPPIRPGV